MIANPGKATKSWALVVVPLLLLPGCATTSTDTAQADSLAERVARVEEALKNASLTSVAAKAQAESARTAAAQLDARVAEQAGKLPPLESRIASLEAGVAGQAGKPNPLEARIAGVEARQVKQGEALDQTAEQVNQARITAKQALDEAKTSEKRIEGTVLYTYNLTNDSYLFPLNSAELDGRDTVVLDEMVERLKSIAGPYHLVIQGHTDDIGSSEHSYLLGEARANAVRRYLNTVRGIPLRRMSTISYGASSPVPENPAGFGTKGNRRVVILVLK